MTLATPQVVTAATTQNSDMHNVIRAAVIASYGDKFNAGKSIDPFLVEAIVGNVADAMAAEIDSVGNAAQDKAFEALITERLYQDAEFGNAARTVTDGVGKKGLTPGEIILTIDKLNGDAKQQWYKPNNTAKVADTMRKIGGCALQFLERYGAPVRVFTDDQKRVLAAQDTAQEINDMIWHTVKERAAAAPV